MRIAVRIRPFGITEGPASFEPAPPPPPASTQPPAGEAEAAVDLELQSLIEFARAPLEIEEDLPWPDLPDAA